MKRENMTASYIGLAFLFIFTLVLALVPYGSESSLSPKQKKYSSLQEGVFYESLLQNDQITVIGYGQSYMENYLISGLRARGEDEKVNVLLEAISKGEKFDGITIRTESNEIISILNKCQFGDYFSCSDAGGWCDFFGGSCARRTILGLPDCYCSGMLSYTEATEYNDPYGF